MKKVDMIVIAPHFYTLEGSGVGYLGDAAMVVDRGAIEALGPQEDMLSQYQAEQVLELPHHVVLPGLIDAHMHTDIGTCRGLAQDTKHWMMYGMGPFDDALSRKEEILGSKVCYMEALRAGTTTFSDSNVIPEQTASFVEKLGVRACLTKEIRDACYKIYAPGELYEFDSNMGSQSLQEGLEFFDRWNGCAGGRIKVFLGPQGADFCSPELLAQIQTLAKVRQTKIHMHVQQGSRETAQIMQRYGKRPIAWLNEIGYLNERLLAVHLTDANDDEVRQMACSGASMIACPGSIGIIDGIVPPSVVFQDAGGIVALGSDQAPGNNCHNMFNEMKLVALFNKIKYQDPEKLPAWRALRMATIDGAKALGLDELVGSLRAGKRADFIAVDLTAPSMMPVYTAPMRNIVPNLVYSARGSEVSLVCVDGKLLLAGGKVLTADEPTIIAEAQACVPDLAARAAKAFWEVNGTNAALMREDKL